MEQVHVVVQAVDPLSLAGMTSSLRDRPEIVLLTPEQRAEADVVLLAADRLSAEVVAGQLRYSERTVKNVFYGITHRLSLRSRSHAVAYALRSGLI